ncbi:hypothetical protein ACIHJG_39925 [Streptomyces sp. NPDC052415]|uniref:hypothetical protein n=1 Tax=Streptomyces sp. NPDC052415 TaxID=3365690 RepID=UPI0037D5E5D3
MMRQRTCGSRGCYLACAVLIDLLLLDMPLVEAVASGGVVAPLCTVAFAVGAIRCGTIAQRLTAAGFFAVCDKQGGQRFLHPGQQLPGHTNPSPPEAQACGFQAPRTGSSLPSPALR